MKYTLLQIKNAAAVLVSAGLSQAAADDLIKNNSDIIPAVLAGDLSGVPSVLSALDIKAAGSAEKTAENVARDPVKKTRKRSAADDNIKAPSSLHSDVIKPVGMMGDNFTDCDIKDHTNENKAVSVIENFDTRNENNADILPAVDGDIIPADDLPANIGATIDDLLADYMQRFNIDDMKKATASQWRGACLVVGDYIKRSGITLDLSRKNPVNNIPCYSPAKVYKLFDAWQLLCLAYDKAPLCADFVAFSGCSDRWFYNDNGHEVSSAGSSIYKKLLEIQQSGLSSRLVDGRINPTGTIFFLKNWHGWKDSREIVHSSGSASVGAESLPLLGQNVDK